MKKLDFGKGALPLYVQLKEIIRQDILDGSYKYMETIPAEITFQNEYNVSRITVRQAISSLEQEGYVERSRGRGTRVIWRPGVDEDVNKLISLTDEFHRQGREIETVFVKVKKEVPPVAVRHFFDSDSPALCIERMRKSEGVPVVVFRTWIPGDMGFPENSDAYRESLYDVYEQVGVHMPVRARDTLYSDLAHDEIARYLNVKAGSPLLIRERLGYDMYNRPVEFTECFFPGDRYRYHIDLSSK